MYSCCMPHLSGGFPCVTPNLSSKSIENHHEDFLPGIYLFKASNRNTRIMCEIFSKLTITIKKSEQRHWPLSLNRFQTLFWCFDCWFGTSKCRLGLLSAGPILDINNRTRQKSGIGPDCNTSKILCQKIYKKLYKKIQKR